MGSLAALCAALLVARHFWPALISLRALRDAAAQLPLAQPATLAFAALLGSLVTVVHRACRQEANNNRVLDQAQVLLCVSGALMMLVISDSLPRAFGIAGAASIIRFRTAVDDSKDAAVLFLLVTLGMASGLGAFALAGAGAVMLCVVLYALGRFVTPEPRSLLVELVAGDHQFPLTHVLRVFAHHGIPVEAREIVLGEPSRAKYLAACRRELALDDVTADFLAGGTSRIRAVTWQPAKRSSL